MGTKSTRSSGTQYNPKGVTQGNTLVDPNTGNPISVITDTEGNRRLAVDANLSVGSITVDTRDLDASTDNVGIKDKVSGFSLKINSDGSIDANTLLDASQDNVAIADATSGNKLKVNSDGSINTTSAASSATTPTVFNVSVPLANTEVSQTLPMNVKKYLIKVRNYTAALQVGFSVGASSSNFISVGRGNSYGEDEIDVSSLTIYFQTDKASQTVEILAWT